MKKLFSFCAAMFAALALNAAVINITPTSPQAADNLRLALNAAADGDEIVMAAGTYVESNGDYIAFAGKHVTVRAAEGANVIIQPQVPVQVTENGTAHFVGVKFDASRLQELANWYEHLIYPADASDHNCIILDGCELYGFNLNKSMLYCSTSNKLETITITNCYIHNTMKSVLFVENTSAAITAQIINSTFADISTNTESYWAGIVDIRNANANLLVDHCTFYNVIPMNTDYSCVSKITLANGVTSNCIFMLPTAQDNIRAMRGVAATNCITYNYLKDSGTGIHSSVTQTNCVQADPLFVDAANGNFTLGEGSPALTMNDGAPIGDPRWVPAPIIGTPEFYLVGSMNGWAPAEAYKFAVNPANDTEYMLNATLAVGDSIKVMKVLGNTQTWFPDGMDNHYTVDAAHAGAKTIYFQEAYKADWAAFGGYFYIEANPAPQQNGYVLKALADIAPTDVVIITMAKGGKVYAMSNEKGTSNPPAAVEVTVANNQIEKDTAIILWNIVKDGDNFTIAPAGNDSLKLYCTNTNNGVRVGKNANNVFSINTAYMYNNATSRFIGVYNEADWRCYTTINSNITGQTLAFYAKEGAPAPQPEPAKFYVTGDTALVADAGVDRMLAWKPNAIKSMNDTLVLNLKAGVDYQLKVTMNGTWDGENNVKGYNELSEKTPGLNDIGNDHNIGFKLNAAGPVKVIYKTAVPNDIFKLEGDFYVETMDTIPTTAPAVPTVAADDVLAIYCNHYTTNNLNFAISGWAGAYQTLSMDSMNVAFWKDMTWECVIDPAHTDDAHDLSGYKKLHVDLWAPKAAKIKFTVEAVAGANYKDGKLVDLAKGWNSFDFNVAEWPGNYDFKNVKCFVLENYSIEHTPFALANIYFYDKEVVQDGMIWKVDSTTAVAAGTTYIDNKMLKVQSVYATTLVVNERTFEDVTFTHAIQVRNAAYPTVAEPNGTENTGSTSLVITAKEDTVIYLYYNRQAKDKAFVVNDGKDMIVFDRADASQVAGEFTFVEINADTTYAKVIKKIHIAKGHAYTVSAKGTTIQLHGIKYPAPVLVPEYYLVGTMNNWTPAEAYQFAANPDAEGEYMLTTTLAVGDNFKVKGMGSIAETWYPDGMGNDYVVTEAYAGEKTIYFRPAGNQAWEAFHAGGFFYMEANPLPEGIITCDSVYRLAKGDTAALAPVTVTYLNGANVYVKDATAGMLIYLPKNTTVDWVAGDVLSNVAGVVDIYNGLYELKPDTNAMKAITKVAGEAPAPEVLNAIQPTDVSKYIKISGIEVTADTVIAASSKTSLNVLFNGDTIVLYNSFKVAQAYEVGKKYDIVGIVSIYKGTLQVCPITVEEQQIIGAPEYYLAGSMNGWAANADYKFVANPAKEGEYMLTTALAVNDEFKVIGVVGATTTWYPDGMGNNYKVDADHAGEAKTIYFRPEGGQQGWYAGYFYLEGNPLTIPTTAPAAPTAAEADVMAIYCNHYTTNNLNFAISGWAGAYQTLDIDSTMIGYWAGMTWECIIDPAPNTDNAHDFSAYKKFHVDLWAPKAAKIKVTVEAVAGGNYKEGVKVDLVQGWNSFDFNVAEWPEGYEFKNVKCFVFEQYQTPAEESFEGNPFAFANLYFYDKESQGLDNTADGVKAQKYIQNGMLLIEKNGKVYTITGLQVK